MTAELYRILMKGSEGVAQPFPKDQATVRHRVFYVKPLIMMRLTGEKRLRRRSSSAGAFRGRRPIWQCLRVLHSAKPRPNQQRGVNRVSDWSYNTVPIKISTECRKVSICPQWLPQLGQRSERPLQRRRGQQILGL